MKTKLEQNKAPYSLSENHVEDLETIVKLIEAVLEHPVITSDTMIMMDEIATSFGVVHNSVSWKLYRAAKQGITT